MRGNWITSLALALAVNACWCVQASADDWDKRYGFYAAGTGGRSFPTGDGNIDIDSNGAPIAQSELDLSLDEGLIATGAAGAYSGAVRGEFEIGYHGNDVDALEGDFASVGEVDGDLTAISFMLNAFYDIRLVEPVVLYVGGGLGLAAIDFDATTLASDGTRYRAKADGAAVAWQVMAGLDFKLTSQVHATIGYRLFSAIGGDGEISSTTGGTDVSVSGDDAFNLPLIHNVEIGLRLDL